MQTLDDSLVNDLLSFYSDHGSCNSQISVCSILTFYHQPSPRNVFFGFIRPDVWSLLSIASCFARKTCSRLLLYCHLPTALYQLKFFQKEFVYAYLIPLFNSIISSMTLKTIQMDKSVSQVSDLTFSRPRSFAFVVEKAEFYPHYPIQPHLYTMLRYEWRSLNKKHELVKIHMV